MFNLPEFHALQNQHCKDLIQEAERERLALEAQRAQPSAGKLSGLAHDLLARLSHIMQRDG